MTHDPDVADLMCRAAEFRLLALAFAYPETDTRRALEAALGDLESRGRGSADELSGTLRTLCARPDLESDYAELFACATPVPLRETAYNDGRLYAGREATLADLSGFYCAFGFELSGEGAELGDFLSVQLEFVSILLLKEAYAVLSGHDEGLDITSRATAAFLDAHLGRWPNAMVDALRGADPGSPYLPLAERMRDRVAVECRRRNVAPAPARRLLTGDPVQADVFSCPHAATCQRIHESQVDRADGGTGAATPAFTKGGTT